MPRGRDRRNDPDNDLTREAIENRYFSHEDPEQERIERKQEQYREEGPDWGI